MTVALTDVCVAQEFIRGAVTATPTTPSYTFSELTGAIVAIKFERLQ